jgi:hypothetical protein
VTRARKKVENSGGRLIPKAKNSCSRSLNIAALGAAPAAGAGQGPLQLVVVEVAAEGGDLEHGRPQQPGVALLHGHQHLAHGRLLQRVEPAGGAEVDQPQAAVGQHEHVAGVGVGVERPSTSIWWTARCGRPARAPGRRR